MMKNKYSLELWRCDMWVWHTTVHVCMYESEGETTVGMAWAFYLLVS